MCYLDRARPEAQVHFRSLRARLERATDHWVIWVSTPSANVTSNSEAARSKLSLKVFRGPNHIQQPFTDVLGIEFSTDHYFCVRDRYHDFRTINECNSCCRVANRIAGRITSVAGGWRKEPTEEGSWVPDPLVFKGSGYRDTFMHSLAFFVNCAIRVVG